MHLAKQNISPTDRDTQIPAVDDPPVSQAYNQLLGRHLRGARVSCPSDHGSAARCCQADSTDKGRGQAGLQEHLSQA